MITRAPSGHRCGECHQNAKLPDAVVREMRATYQSWVKAGANTPGPDGKGYRTLAKIYGCSAGTARDIVTYRTRGNA